MSHVQLSKSERKPYKTGVGGWGGVGWRGGGARFGGGSPVFYRFLLQIYESATIENVAKSDRNKM